jgi:hypothetical protein
MIGRLNMLIHPGDTIALFPGGIINRALAHYEAVADRDRLPKIANVAYARAGLTDEGHVLDLLNGNWEVIASLPAVFHGDAPDYQI